jgi:methyl-accepting chemotaxis protein
MKLGVKIGAGFSAIIILAMLLGATAYFFIYNVSAEVNMQRNFSMLLDDLTTEMQQTVQNTTINTTRFLTYGDHKFMQAAMGEIVHLQELNARLEQVQNMHPELTVSLSKDSSARRATINAWAENLRHLDQIIKRNLENHDKVLTAAGEALKEMKDFLGYMEELLRQEIAEGRLDLLPRRLTRKAYADNAIVLIEQNLKEFWHAAISKDYDAMEALEPSLRELMLYTTQVMLPASRIPRNIENLKIIAKELEALLSTIDAFIKDGKTLQTTLQGLIRASSESQQFIEAAFTFANKFNADSNASIAANMLTAQRYLIIISAIIVLAAIVIAWRTHMVIGPLRIIAQSFNQLAAKDFRIEINQEILRRRDELGTLLRDLIEVCHALSATINEVRGASGTVAHSAEEIHQGNQELNQRTQRQAEAMEQISSALALMSDLVRNSAANSQHANELAIKASQTAQQGGEVVGRAIVAMREVVESSRKISDIITVVNEIAFQTNLLALNAAVEAARAGEAGKGFAVVAGEVRNLAGRSAEAAKQIHTLISESVERVTHGNTLVEESGDLLTQIITDNKVLVDTIGEISSSGQEQARNITDIGAAMNSIDSDIQQNTALVEEISFATESLNSAAQTSLEQVNQFISSDSEAPLLLGHS